MVNKKFLLLLQAGFSSKEILDKAKELNDLNVKNPIDEIFETYKREKRFNEEKYYTWHVMENDYDF